MFALNQNSSNTERKGGAETEQRASAATAHSEHPVIN